MHSRKSAIPKEGLTVESVRTSKTSVALDQVITAEEHLTGCHSYKCHGALHSVHGIGTYPSNIPDWWRLEITNLKSMS